MFWWNYQRKLRYICIIHMKVLIIWFINISTSFQTSSYNSSFLKSSKNLKENNRPVSILSNISKIYETNKQMLDYFGNFFSEIQCGFWQGFSARHYLLVMIERWKKSVDKGITFGAVLADLTKAFDCLPHDLIFPKSNIYGFSSSASKLIYN